MTIRDGGKFPFSAFMIGLSALSGGKAEPPSGKLDFAIFPSVQYAHDDIWYHIPSRFQPVLAVAREVAPGQRG
jgi:hypothetical protein